MSENKDALYREEWNIFAVKANSPKPFIDLMEDAFKAGYLAGRKASEEEINRLKRECSGMAKLLQSGVLYTYKEIDERKKEVESLKKELDQQRFNNKHNLSIDQKVSDEIERLKEELNNSLNFHCPHYLTNTRGTVSCHHEKDKEIEKRDKLLEQAAPLFEKSRARSNYNPYDWRVLKDRWLNDYQELKGE